MKRRTLHPKTHNKERGTVSGIAALGMAAILLSAGLAVDVSHLYLSGGELQNAADAAAIAGASRMNGFAGGITEAVDKALLMQNRFEFAKEVATFARSDVRFGVNSNDLFNGNGYDEATARGMADRIRFIKVAIPNKAITVPFAQLALGSNTVNLSRVAVAGFSAGCETLCDSVVPLSAVQDPNGDPLNIVGSCPNTTQFWPGCTYTVRLGPGGNGNGNGNGHGNGNGSGSISPGNYLILALTGKGGSAVRELMAGTASGCFKPGDEVETKPGVTAGPVRQGWNTRFDDYNGGLDPTDYPPDLNIKEGITYAQYRSGQSAYQQSPNHPGKDGRRVVIIPIVNADEYDNGRDTVRISKFAAFFLQSSIPNGNGGDITAEFITFKVNVTECYGSTGTDNQLSTPTLYK